MSSQNKVVVITGASTGIGYLTAELLAKNNFQVVATMRDVENSNKENAESLSSLSSNISIEELDVSNCQSVNSAIKNTIDKFNQIDVIVNNAGIMNVGLADGFTIEQLNHQMNVNYIGVARLFREALPYMKPKKTGLFITVSSIVGRIIFPFLSTYNPSKFAVEALAEIYRYELSPFNIDSVIVEPGPFSTNLIDNSPHPEDEERLKDYGELADAAEKTMQGFQEFMKDNPDCDPNLVSNAILDLINMEYGERPVRTVSGMDYGVKEINAFTEKYQIGVMEQMGLKNLMPNK